MEDNFEKYDSENEDDPEVYESSGDEWKEEEEEAESDKRKNSRRTSKRLSKMPRITHVDISSDSDEDTNTQSKNGVSKRPKLEVIETPVTVPAATQPLSVNRNTHRRTPLPGTKIATADFVNGGFLILKKDAQLGDPNKHPCLWRIDGKALLQKYEPFEEDGQVRHRNTSIYTGWSSLDKDLYHPVTVKVIQHQGHNMVIELNWDKLKEINNESE